ncbi:MAG: CHAT domain-containing protein [Saprospiraceae bacterium]|nr:CHAT domain-containing protein [Saprospiraceae bacterium]
MESFSKIRDILVCSLTIGLLFGCTDSKYQSVVDLYSCLEFKDSRALNLLVDQHASDSLFAAMLCLNQENIDDFEKYNMDCSMIFDHPIVQKEIFLTAAEKEYEKTSNFKALLDKLEAQKWSNVTTLDKYITCRYLNLKSLLLSELERHEEAEAAILYSIHLLAKNKLKDILPYSYFDGINTYQYILQKAIQKIEFQKELSQRVIDGARKLGFKDLEVDALYRLTNISINPDELSIEKNLELISRNSISKETKAHVASGLMTYLEYPNDHKSIEMCKSILLNQTGKIDTFYHVIDVLGIAEIYAFGAELDSATLYLDLADNLIETFGKRKDWLTYYLNDTRRIVFENAYYKSLEEEYSDSLLFYLDLLKVQADNLYPDKTVYHYNDVVVDHAIDLMRPFEHLENLPKRIQEKVMNAIHLSKNQELKFQIQENRIQKMGNSLNLSSIEKRISEIRLETNGLTKIDEFEKDNLEELYSLVEEKNRIKSEIISTNNFKSYPISTDSIFSLVEKKEIEIIEYITNYETTFIYHLSENGMDIASISNEILDSLINKTLLAVESKNPISTLDELFKTIVPFRISEDISQLIVLKSGPLEKIPFSIFGLKQAIRYSNDLNEVLKSEKIILDKESFSVLSFSDEKTIKNNEIKVHPDLQFGYDAALNIMDLLKIDESSYFGGKSCTFYNFKDACESEGVHLITHGISVEKVKNKNYLIFRDENDYELVSSVDLDYLEHYPKFIFLDACDTGQGKIEIGEGSYSIGRVFLKNGTQTIIKTLWKIDDETASYFSQAFYKAWLKGESAFGSFNIAQDSLISKNLTPYHWAPFVLEGNPNVYLSAN